VVGACAERALPILRRTGELGEFGAVSGEDRPLLGPGVRPALTNWESLCHPTRSSFQTLATSSQGGASLPGATLCRHPSKVRAVCANRARTDPCGGARQLASLPRHRRSWSVSHDGLHPQTPPPLDSGGDAVFGTWRLHATKGDRNVAAARFGGSRELELTCPGLAHFTRMLNYKSRTYSLSKLKLCVAH